MSDESQEEKGGFWSKLGEGIGCSLMMLAFALMVITIFSWRPIGEAIAEVLSR